MPVFKNSTLGIMLIIPPLFNNECKFDGISLGFTVGDIDILNPVTNDFIAFIIPKFWNKAPNIMAIKLPINIVITGLTPFTLAISTNIGGSNNSILKLNIKSNDVNISLASFKFNI